MGNFDFKEGKWFLTFSLKKNKNCVESYTRKCFIKKHGIYYIKDTYKKTDVQATLFLILYWIIISTWGENSSVMSASYHI